MIRGFFCLAAFLINIFSTNLALCDEDSPVSCREIPENGMRVCVYSNHSVPSVFSFVMYDVGQVDDDMGKSGSAHFLEHLMFRRLKGNDASIFGYLFGKGFESNAFTGPSITAYQNYLPKENLEDALEIEAKRMQNLLLSDEIAPGNKASDIELERKIVLEERKMRTDSSPMFLMFERVVSLLYHNCAYMGRSFAGWPEEIKNITTTDLKNMYDTFYVPNNATLFVLGDTEIDEVYKLAKKHFAKIPEKKLNTSRHRDAYCPSLNDSYIKMKIESESVNQPSLVRAYRVKSTSLSQDINLDTIANLLSSSGSSGLLKRYLVEELKLASEVDFFHFRMKDGPQDGERIFVMHATLNSETDIEEVVQKIDDYIGGIDLKSPENVRLFNSEIKRVAANKIYNLEGYWNLSYFYGDMLVQGWEVPTPHSLEEKILETNIDDVSKLYYDIFTNSYHVDGYLLPKNNK